MSLLPALSQNNQFSFPLCLSAGHLADPIKHHPAFPSHLCLSLTLVPPTIFGNPAPVHHDRLANICPLPR